MANLTSFRFHLSQDDAFKAFIDMCTMIEEDNIDAVQADKEWGKYIHSQLFKDYKHILALSEGYFNNTYKTEEMSVMYEKYNRLYERCLEKK